MDYTDKLPRSYPKHSSNFNLASKHLDLDSSKPLITLDSTRHCIDVMHVEKNVCDSLIGTLFNINGKTKDGLNARLDLIEMNLRGELTPIEMGERTYLAPTSYTMSKDEKN